ncbi:hypothetical protein D7V86_23840 [bacterium D16-51]|nr:hypothetical protein D7V96_22175 [bacterium D16-59]RKI54317.1 hypothetical protein D7V86_23840 [bacterium D16-51]
MLKGQSKYVLTQKLMTPLMMARQNLNIYQYIKKSAKQRLTLSKTIQDICKRIFMWLFQGT